MLYFVELLESFDLSDAKVLLFILEISSLDKCSIWKNSTLMLILKDDDIQQFVEQHFVYYNTSSNK